jgi:uncharacterized protein
MNKFFKSTPGDNMKTLFSACALAIALFTAPFAAQAAAANKVVIQISDDAASTWNLALNNAKNVQNALPGSSVEIVAYGPGIGMLKADATVANRIAEAVSAGVTVVACQNTMKAKKLTPADMHGAIGYVPSGVVEIMAKQADGWSYLRP